jgi:asparagine synthase (glutamine-hydrolysing)
MCGISGIVHSGSYTCDENKYIDLIKHRGPDVQASFVHNNLCLFHTRLSILDLSATGSQPMFSTDGNYVIIFNGEIYNHLDIRRDLIKAGHSFRGTSDTETLLYGYIHYGEKVLELLNGIFAFAIFDKRSGDLFISRDHFGVKPLYYYYKDGLFAFSSELKTFTALPDFDRSLDDRAIVNYMSFLWSPGDVTPFRYVKKLRQGHNLRININNLAEPRANKYYQIPFTGVYDYVEEHKTVQALDTTLNDAVKRQLLSDVPVGFYLSGGVDSSLIAVLAQQYVSTPIDCFTINTDAVRYGKEGFEDDLKYARKVAAKNNFRLHEIDARVNIVDDFDKMIWHLDEPQADPAPLNIYNISKAANSMGIKVLLGGTGGDDVFSGYRRHKALTYESLMKVLPRPLISLALQASSIFDASAPMNRRVRKVLQQAGQSKYERLANYYSWASDNTILGLLSPGTQQDVKNYKPTGFLLDLLREIPNEHCDLNKMLYWELNSFLPDHNLNYTDKMSMAVGVETRVPFLDKQLVELSARIDPRLKMTKAGPKHILKKTAEKYLDAEILHRPKTGFGAPVREWVSKDLKDMISDRLNPQAIKSRGLFNEKAVWQLINDTNKGKIDGSYTIWSLLAIESWLRQFS